MLPQTDGNRRPLLRPPRAAMYQMKPGKLLGWWVAGVLAKRGVWHGVCGTNLETPAPPTPSSTWGEGKKREEKKKEKKREGVRPRRVCAPTPSIACTRGAPGLC